MIPHKDLVEMVQDWNAVMKEAGVDAWAQVKRLPKSKGLYVLVTEGMGRNTALTPQQFERRVQNV